MSAIYKGDHFDLITSMATYLNNGYWCHEYKTGYNYKQDHQCEKTCMICHYGNCQTSDNVKTWTYCDDCNRFFKSPRCYQNRKADESAVKKFGTICNQIYKCK